MKIEVISNADGIDINGCYKRKNTVEIDGVNINIISKEDLIKNKKSTDRLIDHSDAEVLESFKANPFINTKKMLKLKLITANMTGTYGSELKQESLDMEIRKKDKSYNNDLKILNKTIELYNKALDTKEEKDVLQLHESFNKNPVTKILYENFKYKLLRKKIYNEIEYRYRLLLKNEYSYLVEKKSTK